jgi:protein gp37
LDMGKDSAIQWTHHTFNPWWGCTRVSPGCTNCYAETFARRVGVKWGPQAERRVFGDKHWNEPLKWNREAEKAGERRRVFCASMADVFEDRPELEAERAKLWLLIAQTPSLDWLLLTKRPEKMSWMAPPHWSPRWPSNVWAMTTVEDQQRAEERLPALKAIPAVVRGLSVEPLLGPLVLDLAGISWVIVGGESGHGARPFDLAWARSIVNQCQEAQVPVFVKQLGAQPWAPEALQRKSEGTSPLRLKDKKGGDPSEWPEELRVRELPA